MKTVLGIVFSAILLAGASCTSTSRNAAVLDESLGLGWLTTRLQDEGVYIVDEGDPNPTITSNESSRLILNNQEVLDVYDFDRSDRARTVATEFAGVNHGSDVYLKGDLVVVRYSRKDTGLNQVLHDLLGRTL